MQPGAPGSGQDPFYNQPPSDPFGHPDYGKYPSTPDPYQQTPSAPGSPYPDQYQNPAAFPGQPVSGQPYADPYQQPGYPAQPTSGQPYSEGLYVPPPVTGQPYADPYQQPGYPVAQPYPGGGYGVPVAPGKPQSNVLGLLSLIFGIISIPFACCYIGALFGAAGVVLGGLGLRKVTAGEANNRGMALAGLVCGAVGLVLTIGLIILVVATGNTSYTYNY